MTTTRFFSSTAAENGHKAGLAVLAGTMTVEEAGEWWLRYANASYQAGVDYLREFDAVCDR